MSTRILSDWLESFIDYTDNSEPPEMFRLWTGISCIAAALKRKCKLQFGYLRIFPNMYIVLVAPPGKARKGTAISFGVDLLMDLQVKMCADSITREALIRQIRDSKEVETTSEGVISAHCSYTIIAPEMTVLINQNQRQMISDLTDMFDCGKGTEGIWEYITKHHGQDKIHGLWINLLGATTPSLIGTNPEIIGSGLSSRMVFVYEEKQEKIISRPFLSEHQKSLRVDLYHDLEIINMMSGEFTYTDGFLDTWEKWYPEQVNNPPFSDEKLAKYCTRRGLHVLKLSLIMCASRCEKMVITSEDMNRAIFLLEATEKKMPHVFSTTGISPKAEVFSNIMKDIGRVREIERRVLITSYAHDIPDAREFESLLKTLENMGYMKQVQKDGVWWIIYQD